MRKWVRGSLAGGIAAVAAIAAAAPAAAKCGHGGVPCPDPVRLRVTVNSPDLGAPIVIRGKDAWTMLNVTGVTYLPNIVRAWDYPPARLGPKYRAIYRFEQADQTTFVYQDVYPFATGRPFTYTPPGQRYVDRDVEIDLSGGFSFPVVEAGEGWRGSRTLGTILSEHGLRAAAADGATTFAAGALGFPGNGDAAGPPVWAWLVVGAGLLGLVGLVARRRRTNEIGTTSKRKR